jgi:hypothetical protein
MREVLPSGAVIAYDALLRKWECWSPRGEFCGYRHGIERARSFAAELPGQPAEPESPRVIPRSPRALPLPEAQYLPTEPRADERPMPPRAPEVQLAYAKGKSMTWRRR